MILFQSDTATPIPFFLASSGNHLDGVVGASPSVSISKNCAAFAAPTGAVAEIGVGWYKLTPSLADVGTAGALMVHVTATACDVVDDLHEVKPANLAVNLKQVNGTPLGTHAGTAIDPFGPP